MQDKPYFNSRLNDYCGIALTPAVNHQWGTNFIHFSRKSFAWDKSYSNGKSLTGAWGGYGAVEGWGGINSYSNRKSHDVGQLQRSHLSGVRGQTNDGTAFHRFRGTWPLGTELWERREKFAETVKGWTWGNIVCKNSLRKYHGSNVERIKSILDYNSPFKAKLKAFLFSQYFRPN